MFDKLGGLIGKFLKYKNHEYNNSHEKATKCIEILFPNGIKFEQYNDFIGIIRILDKISRISNGNLGTENAWVDLLGYAFLEVLKDKKAIKKLEDYISKKKEAYPEL